MYTILAVLRAISTKTADVDRFTQTLLLAKKMQNRTRTLKCETLGAILQVIVCSLVLLALMPTLCLLSCTVCSLVSVAILVVFSNWFGQAILLGFSLGSMDMFTRFYFPVNKLFCVACREEVALKLSIIRDVRLRRGTLQYH